MMIDPAPPRNDGLIPKWASRRASLTRFRRWIGIVLGVASATMTLGVWQWMLAEQRVSLDSEFQLAAEQRIESIRRQVQPARTRRHVHRRRQYFVSEASVFRLLRARGLITSPAHIVMQAADAFKDKACWVCGCGAGSRGRLGGTRRA